MKKKIILLPALLLALTSCGLSFNQNDNNNNNNNNNNSKSFVLDNDTAIKILNASTFFPEVGDEVDLTEIVSFAENYSHEISEYAFESSNPDAITIEGFHAKCVGEGYTAVKVTGPGINKDTFIYFYVGSIAGTYTPSARALRNKVTFTIGKEDENRVSEFQLHISEGVNYNRASISPYDGSGTMFKNGTPFMQLDFETSKPKSFAPITDYIASFGIADEFMDDLAEFTGDVYGMLKYDEFLQFTAVFAGELVVFEIVE